MENKRGKSRTYATSFSYLISFVFDLITAVIFTFQVSIKLKEKRKALCNYNIWENINTM